MAEADDGQVAIVESEDASSTGFFKRILTRSRIRIIITGGISSLVMVGVCVTILGVVLMKKNDGFDCNLSEADIVIALDTSSSIGQSNFAKMKTFCKNFLSHARINTDDYRVAVVTFSTKAYTEFGLQKYECMKDVMQAIDDIPYDFKGTGATYTNKVLQKIRTRLFSQTADYRGSVKNYILLLTDGLSKDRTRTVNQAREAHGENITIYAIGIDLSDMTELYGIASKRENALNVQGYDELGELSTDIFEAFCKGTGIKHLQGEENLGFANETSIRRLSKFKPPSCTGKTDIAFVVDSSSRISQYEFKMQTAFIYDIVDFLNVGKNESRVAALSFSDRVAQQFNFKKYDSKEDVLNAIENIEFTGGNAMKAGDALEYVNKTFFTVENGDRSDVTDIIVILTDAEIHYDFTGSNISRKVAAIRKAQTVAIEIKKRPMYIFIIGIGDVNIEQLSGMSSKPDETYAIHVSNFKQLNTDDIRQRLLYRICIVTEFIPKYTTLPEASTPYRILPNSYTGCGMKKLDIVMILDTSTSIGIDKFSYILAFCRDFSSMFDIDSGNVRFGLSTFSNDVNTEFALNTYNDSYSLYKAIPRTMYRYGDTNVLEALKSLSKTMFTPDNGDRPEAQNIAIMITDGKLNTNFRGLLKKAKAIREKGISLFTICVALEESCGLDDIAFVPSWSFHKKSYNELLMFNDTFFEKFCLDLELIASIAYGKQTQQSSNAELSRLAVDGDINTFTSTNHLSVDVFPYWSVDLGQEYLIKQLEVFNRKDCCGEDLHSLDITVGQTLNNMSLCFRYKGPSRTGERLVLQCEDKGRYVKLTKREKGVLQFAEVNIKGEIQISNEWNEAYGKSVTQSTTEEGFDAKLAIDGKTDTFSRTKYQLFENLPSWHVDLQHIYRLDRIEIHNEEICCDEQCKDKINGKTENERAELESKDETSHEQFSPKNNVKEQCKDKSLDNLQVTFGSTLDNATLCKPHKDNRNKTIHYTCEEIEYGSYVIVRRLAAGVLALGEVMVFGDQQCLTYAQRTGVLAYFTKGNEMRVRCKDIVSDDKDLNWWIDLRKNVRVSRIKITNMNNDSFEYCRKTENEMEFSGDSEDDVSDTEFSGACIDDVTYTNSTQDTRNDCDVAGALPCNIELCVDVFVNAKSLEKYSPKMIEAAKNYSEVTHCIPLRSRVQCLKEQSKQCFHHFQYHAQVTGIQQIMNVLGCSNDTSAAVFDPNTMVLECRMNLLGLGYRGKQSTTKQGRTCQAWSSQTPHKHDVQQSLYTDQNYCRNPDNEPYGPWCYTTDVNHRWEYCDVQYCVLPCNIEFCEDVFDNAKSLEKYSPKMIEAAKNYSEVTHCIPLRSRVQCLKEQSKQCFHHFQYHAQVTGIQQIMNALGCSNDTSAAVFDPNTMVLECRMNLLGLEYRGKQNTTKQGRTCQAWSSQSPHKHSYQQSPNTEQNYCRNPDNEPYGPWCYTTDVNHRWEYCDVPYCSVHNRHSDIFELGVVGGLRINDMSSTFRFPSTCDESHFVRYIKLKGNGKVMMSIKEVAVHLTIDQATVKATTAIDDNYG